MLTEQPNVVAILSRNNEGMLVRTNHLIDLHREPIITIVPNHQGVILVLDTVSEQETVDLAQLLENAGSTQAMGEGLRRA